MVLKYLESLLVPVMKAKRIDSYHITNHLLGQGSFSQVYLAYTPQLQKVAVKIIPRNNIKQNQIELFQRQINLLNQCKHQNIIQMFDVKKTKTNFYIFLEYSQDGNLAEYIQGKNFLSEHQAMTIFSQLLKAMAVMSRSNIVHRDLKSANIMLKNDKIKIIDFGLATKYQKGQFLRSYSGTPLNMAPEILKGQDYNDKAEIYSAGTILFEMLFGRLPFEDSTQSGLIAKIESSIKDKKFLQNSNQVSNISNQTKELLIKMLEPNPQKRIDLEGVMMAVKKWENHKINQKLNTYKRISAGAIPYIGMIGGLSQILNINLSPTKAKSIYDMDLKMCGKLGRKLIEKQAEWKSMLGLIQV